MESWLMPMLCGSTEVAPEGEEWIMERKLDGWRGMFHVKDGQVRLFGGRNGSSYTGKLPYIERELLARLPDGTALDGELLAGEWGDVQGVMTRGAGAHVPTELHPALTFVAFDVLSVGGTDIRHLAWRERRKLLEAVDPFGDCEHLRISEAVPASQATHELWVAEGAEGSVYKLTTARYVNGRSRVWLKCKARETCEARVVGFKPGKTGGEWDGKVGAFEVELLDNGARTTVKCGTNERHNEATEHPERWLNVVIELAHNGIQPSGKPRHPQFFRRRDDRVGTTPTPTTPRRAPKVSTNDGSTGRMRNYGAMKDPKLLKCIAELEKGTGEAYNRALNGSGNPAADLATAKGIALNRGLELPAAA